MSSTFTQKLQYAIPMTPDDIQFCVIDTSEYRPRLLAQDSYSHLYQQVIGRAQHEVADKYGVSFGSNAAKNVVMDKVHYFLFGLVDPLCIDDAFLARLRKAKMAPNSRVNLAMIFDKQQSDVVRNIILALDKDLGVNTIYQDTEVVVGEKTYVTISPVDAADNMVCETFRVKYRTIQRQDKESLQKLRAAREEAWTDVQRMEEIYTINQLWHRSPYDGAFMFRTRHGWLTTATRTRKNNVQKNDLSLILRFDEKTETITYAGDRLPSSDLPEFLVLVARNELALADQGEKTPVIRYLAHFHKNEITRNPLFAKYAIPFSRYGVSVSGHIFADELLIRGMATDGINIHGKGRGFIILEHGLVRMGVELDHFEKFLKLFL